MQSAFSQIVEEENLKPSVQAIINQVEFVDHQSLSHFSHKDIFGLYFLNRGEHKVRDGMSYTPKVFTYRQVSILITSLYHTVPVATEPVLCTLPCFTTVLWPIRAGPVTLGAGANVEQVAGGAGHAPPDSQVFSCAADGHRLQYLAKSEVGVGAQSAASSTTPLEPILCRSGQPERG